MTAHDSTYRLLYRDVDQMGVLYYSRYFELMEMGRTEWARSQDFIYSDMEKNDGLLLAVINANCSYKASLRFDEIAVVRTSVKAYTRATLCYYTEIFEQESGRLCAAGEVELGCLTTDTLTPHKLPDSFMEILRRTAPDGYGRRKRT
ncbi:MAG: acyl-CoA thioesterase [Planctomycetes bacterium]|nr:acyl-CoA thioesterase [Planctomycetota bacterium]MCP4771321.1 acyl-CoA thioesterase [Planctomycetota bacterium]MCP4860446.1 acyl-CoA thioesterase [Planctomycetota bacterium]